ncbi:MAG TPA: hypothetical protein VLT89_09625 [Usitatibacter sp.]|nr:hypothetical protein [Usitatibacter sp.]
MQQTSSPDSPAQPVFVWSDAWVMASVAVGGGLKGCELKDVVAAGELLNRALLSPMELRGALAKLLARGYVDRTGSHYVIAGEARYAVEQILRQHAPSFNVMQFFEEFLDVDAYAANDADAWAPGRGSGDITEMQAEAAIAAHRAQVAGIWRELRRVDDDSLPERAVRVFGEAARAHS